MSWRKKIAQNVAQRIFVKVHSKPSPWRNVAQKMWNASFIFIKLPIVNDHPPAYGRQIIALNHYQV
jgi:hypothetical protein